MIRVNEGKVYYHKRINKFCQVRYVHDDYLLISSANYYEDSKTSIHAVPVSYDYMKDVVEVCALDKIGHGIHFDGMGWRVSEYKQPKERR